MSVIFISNIVNVHAFDKALITNLHELPIQIGSICNSVKNVLIPVADLPNDILKKKLEHCDSTVLYYGFDKEPDYTMARYCALINQDWDILTMIYANGKGIQRDLSIAIYFACLLEATPHEFEKRVKHLNYMKNGKLFKKEFDFCDDAISRDTVLICMDLDKKLNDSKQEKNLNALIAKWSLEEKYLYKNLQKASVDYFESRIENEMEMSGSGAVEISIMENINLNNRMIDHMKKINQCDIPHWSNKQYKEADNKLNYLYNKLKKIDFSDVVGIKMDGIKKTEKSWLKYRDSWVLFGHKKCPDVSIDSWKMIITNERITELEHLTIYNNLNNFDHHNLKI